MVYYSFSKNDLPDFAQFTLNNASFFYSENYYNYLLSTNGIPVYFYSEYFLLLVIIYKKYFLKYVIIPCENIVINDIDCRGLQPFLDEIMDILRNKFGVKWVNQTPPYALFNTFPSCSERIPFGNHIIDLKKDDNQIWLEIHSKHRNSIRKAEKAYVNIEFGLDELLNDYVTLDTITWKRSNKESIGSHYFSTIIDYCKPNILIAVAYKNKTPQGGAIFYFSKKMSYYMFGASKNNPEGGSLNLLHWKAIIEMKKRGVEKYSFVGARIDEDKDSKFHGIQRFKERFGGELVCGYMFKVIFSPVLYKIAFLVRQLLYKEKYLDIIDQEKHKWKSLEA